MTKVGYLHPAWISKSQLPNYNYNYCRMDRQLQLLNRAILSPRLIPRNNGHLARRALFQHPDLLLTK
jgi:hypothetical protein